MASFMRTAPDLEGSCAEPPVEDIREGLVDALEIDLPGVQLELVMQAGECTEDHRTRRVDVDVCGDRAVSFRRRDPGPDEAPESLVEPGKARLKLGRRPERLEHQNEEEATRRLVLLDEGTIRRDRFGEGRRSVVPEERREDLVLPQVECAVDDGEEQSTLAAEMEPDRAATDSGGLRDRLEGRVGGALLGDEPERRVQELLAGLARAFLHLDERRYQK